jgi:pyruvate/2-oxoglutarate/acetoin dehydrogenase E1 component/TPP-dependent pyruvate/acetoin dehydrogenase alpha subunit
MVRKPPRTARHLELRRRSMASFRDTDQLYRVFDAFFRRVADQRELADALLGSRMVLRLRYKDPDGQVTIDLGKAPIRWEFGETSLEPELELIQSADVANRFWQGRLNITSAIATRKVVARGPIKKALALLPALEGAYPLYADVLRELGESALLVDEAAHPPLGERLLAEARRVAQRARGHLPGRRGVDFDALEPHRIPLVDEVEAERVALRPQDLPGEPDALAVEMLRRMRLIRAFEEHLAAAWARGEVPTEAIHLSIGQEATAVGACFALGAGDYLATTHRGHGHMLAKGADLDGMMAELLGRATGLCGGKGGSMHVTDSSVGAIGANGIVGASGLIAAGAAHAAQLAGSDQVAVAFLGDGATNQGMFHEAVNLAAVFGLPVLFVIENNLYGEFTPLARHTRVTRLADRAAAYGIPGVDVDGNDARAVYQATCAAVERARRGGGPTLLECRTYRWHGHMEGETAAYRSADEIETWKARCPITALERALLDDGVLTDVKAAALADEARSRVSTAWKRASEAAEPEAGALYTDIYSPEPRSLYTAPAAPPVAARDITCSKALFEALAEELERDERVYLLGEDVTTGGYFAVTSGLVERFGTSRIVDTPISEYAIVGSAVGAAIAGRRPVCEILFSDFLTTCMDPLVNQAAKLRYMSGGQYSLPMVVRTPGGAGLGMAAQHSQSLEALLTGIPGLLVVAPGTAADAKGLLKAAIRSNNPVLFFENKLMYAEPGPVPDGEFLVPLGVADVKRAGTDATVVSIGAALGRTLEAARLLDGHGVSAEVIDVRTLVPLDLPTIVRSVARTGRLVTVEDGPVGHGFGSEVVARIVEVAHSALCSAPRRVGAADVPLPYNSKLENAALPDAERIAATVEKTL